MQNPLLVLLFFFRSVPCPLYGYWAISQHIFTVQVQDEGSGNGPQGGLAVHSTVSRYKVLQQNLLILKEVTLLMHFKLPVCAYVTATGCNKTYNGGPTQKNPSK